MTPARRDAMVIGLALLVTAVALVEAVAAHWWDQVALLAAIAGLLLALFTARRTGRRGADVRSDLARWLDDQAAATGEPAGQLLDRCIATYRAGQSVPATPEPKE